MILTTTMPAAYGLLVVMAVIWTAAGAAHLLLLGLRRLYAAGYAAAATAGRTAPDGR
jgi:hypothetical protein